jgi:hypothetical protein
MSWELIIGFLPWLLLLACPLSMFWMMRGMSHGESCGNKTNDAMGSAPAAVPVSNPDEEIRILRERLARLEAQPQATENWS